jgi:hypothetical protein
MEENLLKKWIDENIKDTKGLPKTWAEASTIMRVEFSPLDTISIAELETFAKNGKNKVYIAVYANCLLKARKTGNYVNVNRFRRKIGMAVFQDA